MTLLWLRITPYDKSLDFNNIVQDSVEHLIVKEYSRNEHYHIYIDTPNTIECVRARVNKQGFKGNKYLSIKTAKDRNLSYLCKGEKRVYLDEPIETPTGEWNQFCDIVLTNLEYKLLYDYHCSFWDLNDKIKDKKDKKGTALDYLEEIYNEVKLLDVVGFHKPKMPLVDLVVIIMDKLTKYYESRKFKKRMTRLYLIDLDVDTIIMQLRPSEFRQLITNRSVERFINRHNRQINLVGI